MVKIKWRSSGSGDDVKRFQVKKPQGVNYSAIKGDVSTDFVGMDERKRESMLRDIEMKKRLSHTEILALLRARPDLSKEGAPFPSDLVRMKKKREAMAGDIVNKMQGDTGIVIYPQDEEDDSAGIKKMISEKSKQSQMQLSMPPLVKDEEGGWSRVYHGIPVPERIDGVYQTEAENGVIYTIDKNLPRTERQVAMYRRLTEGDERFGEQYELPTKRWQMDHLLSMMTLIKKGVI